MNILIAIDSFKGSLTTNELADAIELGIIEASTKFEVKKIPIADGGEGTYETLVQGLGGTNIKVQVKDPLFNEITCEYGMLEDKTAIIEMAQSSGLTLVPKAYRNPLHTTTYGVGEMIKDAISRGSRSFIIGIGGSATNDAGIGMLHALGFDFYDEYERLLSPVGGNLSKIHRIEDKNVLKELKECEFLIACDVDNPLYGTRGAAYVYGPQKGATEEIVEELDKGLKHFSKLVKKTYDKDINEIPGSGAAGGLGGGFVGFLNATLSPGTDIIFNKLNINQYMDWADMIVTGEGRLDFQTVMGKAPTGVSLLARQKDIPVIAIAGSVTDDASKGHEKGITAMFSILDGPMSLEQAMDKQTAKKLVYKTTNELFRLIDKLQK